MRATGLDLHFAPQREQNKGSPPSSRRRQQSTGLLQRMGSSPVFPQTKRKRGAMPLFFFWCGRQDSNLHAFAEEPKGDVTLVNVLRCVKNTFLNNSNGYYRNAQVSSFVGDISILLFHQLAVYFLLGNAVDEKSNVLHLSSFEPAN